MAKNGKVDKNWKIPRMSKEEIKSLARDIVTRNVYITNTDEGLRCSFGLMLSFLLSKISKKEFLKIGACYSEWAKAGPRGINGYPAFFSMSIVHKEDMPFLLAEIENMTNALNTALGTKTEEIVGP